MDWRIRVDSRITLPKHFKSPKTIGRSALSELIRARDSRTGQTVAVKALYPIEWLNRTEDSARRQKMVAGLTRLTELRHPVLADVYEIGEYYDTLYVAREYIESPPLSSRFDSKISVSAAREI